MTKTLQEYKCKAKKQYPTLKKAWRSSAWFFKTRGSYNRPYHCPVCKKYHLTHYWARPSNIFKDEINKWFGWNVLPLEPPTT